MRDSRTDKLMEEEMARIASQSSEESEIEENSTKVEFPVLEALEPEEKKEERHDTSEKDGEAQEVKKKPPTLDGLIFVRLVDPIHIPSYLIHQVRDKLFTTDRFYDYQKIACCFHTNEGPRLNPISFLYAIISEELKQVKGFAWFTIDLLTNSLEIRQFSIDKEYWQKGLALSIVVEKAKSVKNDLKISRIYWLTKHVKSLEPYGFQKQKESLMLLE